MGDIPEHRHEDYAASSNVICTDCEKAWEICAMCNETWHECKASRKDDRIPAGFSKYRVVADFPDYMINKQATIRHIATQRLCMLVRVSSSGGALVSLRKGGKTYTRAAQDLRDAAFND